MASKTIKKKKEYNVPVVFANDLSKELRLECLEATISLNMRELVPAHQQEELLNQFVEAGFMAP